MKISLICPVRLSFYEGQTKNPDQKFRRSIDSFLAQTYKNAELIIACDGDEEAAKIVKSQYVKHLKTGLIKLLELPRHELFNGSLRQSAIDIATGDLVGSLDSDDIILPNHLWNINVAADLSKFDWFFYNLYRKLDNLDGVEELVNATPDLEGLCNGNLLWKRNLDVTWNNCNGRSDSKAFISQILEKYPRRGCKLYGCSYVVKNAVIKK